MKSVEVSPLIEANPQLGAFVQRANEFLEKTIGPYSSPLVSVHWEVGEDDRRRLLQLKLSDFTGTRTYFLLPEDLKRDWHLGDRLLELWGDFLQIRSHKQLDAILKSSAQSGTAL